MTYCAPILWVERPIITAQDSGHNIQKYICRHSPPTNRAFKLNVVVFIFVLPSAFSVDPSTGQSSTDNNNNGSFSGKSRVPLDGWRRDLGRIRALFSSSSNSLCSSSTSTSSFVSGVRFHSKTTASAPLGRFPAGKLSSAAHDSLPANPEGVAFNGRGCRRRRRRNADETFPRERKQIAADFDASTIGETRGAIFRRGGTKGLLECTLK